MEKDSTKRAQSEYMRISEERKKTHGRLKELSTEEQLITTKKEINDQLWNDQNEVEEVVERRLILFNEMNDEMVDDSFRHQTYGH